MLITEISFHEQDLTYTYGGKSACCGFHLGWFHETDLVAYQEIETIEGYWEYMKSRYGGPRYLEQDEE